MKLTTCWLAFQHHHAPTVLSPATDAQNVDGHEHRHLPKSGNP